MNAYDTYFKFDTADLNLRITNLKTQFGLADQNCSKLVAQAQKVATGWQGDAATTYIDAFTKLGQRVQSAVASFDQISRSLEDVVATAESRESEGSQLFNSEL